MPKESRKDSQIKNTSEQTSTQSPGTTKKHCDKHGDYTSTGTTIFGNRVIWSKCPECQKEYEKKEQDIERRLKNQKIIEMLDESGIPARFKDKKLTDLKYITEKQRKTLKAVNGYLKVILDGSSASLILCGKPGTGKTHIGCAIITEMVKNNHRSVIISTGNLMRKVKATYQNNDKTEDEIYEFYGRLPLLVLDEVGVQFGSETEKLVFYEVINMRYNNMLPTILISNLTAEELSGYVGERAFDRFKEDGGAILVFDWESYRK